MATVYSLVCWGGLTGKGVSISATTDVVTLTNHGLRNGTKLWPSGTLPSELNTSTPVYARSTGANTFTLHTSAAGAIANTGQILFAGSSTYAAVTLKSDLVASPSTALSAYGLSDLSRWGASGSERIYGSLANWNTSRSAASKLDTEIAEIAEPFDDWITSNLTINVPAAKSIILPKIDGKYTDAFHYGALNSGYVLKSDNRTLTLGVYYAEVRDFTVYNTGPTYASGINLGSLGTVADGMVVIGNLPTTDGVGITIAAAAAVANNCFVAGYFHGFVTNNYLYASRVSNCVSLKNRSHGFYAQYGNNAGSGYWYNNIALGNLVADWFMYGGTATPGTLDAASNNAGSDSTKVWKTGSNPTYQITSADFVSYGGASWSSTDDYRIASGSVLIDNGVSFYGVSTSDIEQSERPSYNNGGAEYVDIGPYEFDKGFGPHPATHTLTLTNVAVDSRVFIRDQADTVTHYDQVAAASTVVIPITVYGDSRDNWRIKVRKASAAPYYQPWETIMTATAGASSIYVSQIPD